MVTKMSSEFDVDEDNQLEIPSDIPVYSEINIYIKRESSSSSCGNISKSSLHW